MTSIKQLIEEGREAEANLKGARIGSWAGGLSAALIIGVWCIAAGHMLVSFGAWGWVVWPFFVYVWMNRVGKAAAQGIKNVKEAEEKVALTQKV